MNGETDLDLPVDENLAHLLRELGLTGHIVLDHLGVFSSTEVFEASHCIFGVLVRI